MKKLQNNFTTPEQSKRLLELGVPEWTADLRYRICKVNDSILGNPYLTKGKKYTGSHFNSSLPCWSVGRLIEIYLLCAELKKPQMIFIKEDVLMMDRMINELCYMAESERLDLSKLEE